MSTVTNLILTLPLESSHVVDKVNAWYSRNSRNNLFVLLSGQAGGDKMMEHEVYLGSSNVFDLHGLVKVLDDETKHGDAIGSWTRADMIRRQVRLFIEQQQDEEGFHEVTMPWRET